MTVTFAESRLTGEAVERLVRDWCAARDRHEPIERVLPFLTTAGLVMHMPHRTLRGIDAFRAWYEEATAAYFDEAREVAAVQVRITSPLHAEAVVQLNWQAWAWEPPAPHSRWFGYDLVENWSVVLQDGRPKIRIHSLQRLSPMTGSAPLAEVA